MQCGSVVALVPAHASKSLANIVNLFTVFSVDGVTRRAVSWRGFEMEVARAAVCRCDKDELAVLARPALVPECTASFLSSRIVSAESWTFVGRGDRQGMKQ